MESITLDGNVYLGYISIPDINIELPVLKNWSYPNLKISPCRYMGSVFTDDMIICAHNYTTHFGKIGNLHTDSEIIFTDVNGKEYRYQVINMAELSGTAVEQMQFGDAEDWDLTLFTCTLGGQTRVTVRAARIEE
ncbi:MAG: Sortase family protein [Firmicutes bacterium ADurb.BinA205]|nr:MAG: Sortase family protein [Firmicutes bacterium ADurb.BinA205]